MKTFMLRTIFAFIILFGSYMIQAQEKLKLEEKVANDVFDF